MEVQVMFTIVSGEHPLFPEGYKSWDDSRQSLWDLCTRCWEHEPRNRPTMAEVADDISSIINRSREEKDGQPSHESLATSSAHLASTPNPPHSPLQPPMKLINSNPQQTEADDLSSFNETTGAASLFSQRIQSSSNSTIVRRRARKTSTFGPPDSSGASEGSEEFYTSPRNVWMREGVLKEWYYTESAYASDLAFVQNVYVPMAYGTSLNAVGQPLWPLFPTSTTCFRFPNAALPNPDSPHSMSGEPSSSEAPMSKEDIQTIFRNHGQLVAFSDMFSRRLKVALGDALEGGKGEDRVGRLLLEIVSSSSFSDRCDIDISVLSTLR